MSSSSLASGSGAFALDVYNVLRKSEQGNIFFSPFSITSAFGMVYAGAGSSTKDEMTKAMRLPFDEQSKNLGAFQDLLPKIKGDGSVTLDTANRVYVQEGAKILDDYMAALKKHFQNTVESANFGDDAQRVKINAWVEEQTRNKIKDLLPSGSLNALTRLVVVNAVYFKGNWAKQFDPQQTKAMPFHLSSSNSVDVPMMMKKTHYNVYDVKGLKADIVEIPYQGDAMSMVLIIPKEVDGLKEVEAGLTHDVLATITTPKPRSRELTLYLPKFKLETSFKLKAPLAELGMKSLFDQSEADLSGITGDKSLYVSEGYHKAFLEVNEEGTEAAAATGVVMMLRAMPMNIVVKADRPFLLLIKEKATGTVLFMGNLVDPRA